MNIGWCSTSQSTEGTLSGGWITSLGHTVTSPDLSADWTTEFILWKQKYHLFFQTNPIFIIKHTLTCTITYRHNHLIFQYLAYVEFVKLTSSDLIRTFFYCTKIKLGFGTRSNLDCPLPRPPSPNRLIIMYFILYLISHRHCISICMHS